MALNGTITCHTLLYGKLVYNT